MARVLRYYWHLLAPGNFGWLMSPEQATSRELVLMTPVREARQKALRDRWLGHRLLHVVLLALALILCPAKMQPHGGVPFESVPALVLSNTPTVSVPALPRVDRRIVAAVVERVTPSHQTASEGGNYRDCIRTLRRFLIACSWLC
jgi:hypothetical protein